MIDSSEPIQREVKLGKSKLDFKVGNIYMVYRS